jgi:phosphoribosyl 1,2-cyclic phosphodiesterase
MKIQVWGARGSIPSPCHNTLRFGGNTSCVTVDFDEFFIIFDAGSGIRLFGDWLLSNKKLLKGHLFFTHYHADHVQGFPFFASAYIPGNKLDIYGAHYYDKAVKTILVQLMKSPTFPVGIETMNANLNFIDLAKEETKKIIFKDTLIATVKNMPLRHPDGAIGYRLEDIKTGRVFVYATDTEHKEDGSLDENIKDLAQGADVLFYDSQYTREEYYGLNGKMSKKTWGHSTWEEGIRIAEAAGVKELFLFHHDPSHTDDMLTHIENEAREYLKKNKEKFKKLNSVQMAYEGLTIILK